MQTTTSYTKKFSKRAKRISISVHPDKRGVVVTIPDRLFYRPNSSAVDRFILKNTNWIDSAFEKIKRYPKVSYPFTSGKRSYEKYKEYSRNVISKRVEELSNSLNFTYKNIFIRNQKTRWGSCSENKNLNFNYKLAFLPERLRDYIIIHELCHLEEMNHGKRFWKLVESISPEYKKAERELRTSFKL